ncbi:MAG: GNAT family N-acetyltransferase [Bacteroidetes bacterium]|nr:GNAT family N-acetyltransferase [Bacteroidota bacterium]
MIEVQTYTDKYKNEVNSLILSIQQDEFGLPITLEDQPDLKNIPLSYQKEKGNFWIAIFNGKVIGTIGLIDIGHYDTALRKMFVDRDFRGKQYQTATKLFETLIFWVRKEKIKSIYLGTRSEMLAAHRFYEKNGFIEIATNDLPKHFPRMPVDNKFYQYYLAERETHNAER